MRVSIVLFSTLAFLLRYHALQQTSYANGWDSYFYLIQFKSWMETGQMHSPETNLIYACLSIFYQLSGDYLLAFKLTSAFAAALFTFACTLWSFSSSTSNALGKILGAWSVFSPHLTYYCAQYPKNLLGIAIFLLALYGLWKKKWIGFFLALIASYFAHRMTVGLLGVFLGLFSFFSWWKPSTKVNKYLLASGVGLITLLFFGAQFFPGVLGILDLERFDGVFTITPQFAPWSFLRDFGAAGRLNIWWCFEIVAMVGLFFWSVWNALRQEVSPFFRAYLLIMIITLFPFFTWNFTGMSFRFFLAFVLLAPLLSLTIKVVIPEKWLFLGTIGLLITSLFTWSTYRPQLQDPNYARYERITQKTLHFLKDRKVELVIAHKSLAEYFTFTTSIDALPWIPEYDIRKDQLWRIAADLPPYARRQLGEYAEEAEIQLVGPGYVLLLEKSWQQFYAATKENDPVLWNEINSWHNPARVRPSYLLKNKTRE